MVKSSSHDIYGFAMRLVDAEGDAVALGETFRNNRAGLVRLSSASTPETIEEVIARIARFIAHTTSVGMDEASNRHGWPRGSDGP